MDYHPLIKPSKQPSKPIFNQSVWTISTPCSIAKKLMSLKTPPFTQLHCPFKDNTVEPLMDEEEANLIEVNLLLIPKVENYIYPNRMSNLLKFGHLTAHCWFYSDLNYKLVSSNNTAVPHLLHHLTGSLIPELHNTLQLIQITIPTLKSPRTATINYWEWTNSSISHSGQGLLATPTYKLLLQNLLYFLHLSHNLLCISKLSSENSYYFVFDNHGYTIKDRKINATLLQEPYWHGLYTFQLSQSAPVFKGLLTNPSKFTLWHTWLGLLSASTMQLLSTIIP